MLWLLGTSSPIYGNAHVHLSDTRFFVLARLVDVLLGREPVHGIACPGRNPDTRAMALTLHRSGEQSYGMARWQEFLTQSANLFRTNNRWLPKMPVQMFYATVQSMAWANAAADVRQVVSLLPPTRPIAEATRSSHLQNPKLTPLMEPLLPARNRTVHYWGSYTRALSVLHDEQSAVTQSASPTSQRPRRRARGKPADRGPTRRFSWGTSSAARRLCRRDRPAARRRRAQGPR